MYLMTSDVKAALVGRVPMDDTISQLEIRGDIPLDFFLAASVLNGRIVY